MLIDTRTLPFVKARKVNCTDGTAFTFETMTRADPLGAPSFGVAGRGTVFDLMKGPYAGANAVMLVPFGVGADNTTFSLEVVGWSAAGEGTDGSTLWVPVVLCQILCTLSATNAGLAGGVLGTTDLVADTLSLTFGTANISTEIVTPATNGIFAHALVDLKGAQRVEVLLNVGSSATSANCLCKFL